jgi:hypothetical protein
MLCNWGIGSQNVQSLSVLLSFPDRSHAKDLFSCKELKHLREFPVGTVNNFPTNLLKLLSHQYPKGGKKSFGLCPMRYEPQDRLSI